MQIAIVFLVPKQRYLVLTLIIRVWGVSKWKLTMEDSRQFFLNTSKLIGSQFIMNITDKLRAGLSQSGSLTNNM